MRLRIGDILEFETPKGLAYAQYSHEHPEYGELTRVLPGLHQHRPSDLSSLAQAQERFYVFYPVRPEVKDGLIRVAGSAPVPDRAKAFPMMRAPGAFDLKTGETRVWWLWDGTTSTRIGDLTPDLAKLSIKSFPSYSLLVERLADEWSPEDRQ